MFNWIKKNVFGISEVKSKKLKPLILKDEVKSKKLSKAKLDKMTKTELEAYGRKFGFEVDRRETKAKIVKQVAKLK
jgi:hypothetical protein|tara:strand:- start:1155 stop:1382 length:228 start_codon:yes stop_codon:yes gene_type:complete